MKAYGIGYTYNGRQYTATVDARDKEAARNKIGRRHGLKADEAKREIRINSVSVIGYF